MHPRCFLSGLPEDNGEFIFSVGTRAWLCLALAAHSHRPHLRIGKSARAGHGGRPEPPAGGRRAQHRHHKSIHTARRRDRELDTYLLSVETVTIHQERCVLNVMLDITERKQTESQLLSAIESVMQDTS